jgi:putative ABC transport system permease protein
MYAVEKSQETLLSIFGLLTIIVSCMGLFGLTMFLTEQKTKEIGVRKVNGATVFEILVMLSKGFVVWVLIAFAIATPIAYYAMRKWLTSFAYKTELSWWVFALAGCIALVIALLTVSWQTFRAARRNPVEALRYE